MVKKSVNSIYIPKPLFDTLEYIEEQVKNYQTTNNISIFEIWLQSLFGATKIELPTYALTDYKQVLLFLYSYRGSIDTFNSYRRELERLVQWCWFVQKISVFKLKNTDLESFIEFCMDPPKRWIATKVIARFIDKEGTRTPNAGWRPFVVKISKKSHQDGDTPEKKDFVFSQQGIKLLFNILSSFYNYLIQEELITSNPVMLIRQKGRYIRKEQQSPTIRRLSVIQWDTVIKTAISLAEQNPALYERTLFIMNILYSMYLRISELAASERWTPKMGDFFRDTNGDWWFKTVGKGNKARQIAVSMTMLTALKRWRAHLGLAVLPISSDKSPLLPKQKSNNPITSTRAIRMIVQTCFDEAIRQLQKDKLNDEAEMLRSATVHWLRHTGISDDVKIRPREHVRDDAGHSSSSITDKYIDIELQERAKSARKKVIIQKEDL